MAKDLNALKDGEKPSKMSYIVTDVYEAQEPDCNCSCDCCCSCGGGYGAETLGIRLATATFDEVEIKDGKLFFFGKEVIDYPDYCKNFPELVGKIPSLYTVRKHNGDYYRFVTGFDLLSNGTVWHGGIRERIAKGEVEASSLRFADMKSAITHLNDVMGDEWVLTLEEPMRL